MEGTLTGRYSVVAFYGIKGSGDTSTVTYHRMQGFTTLTTSKNPKEYTRQYVDEDHEQTDVVGYSPSIAYTFDRYAGNAVQDDIVRITNQELTGNDALAAVPPSSAPMPLFPTARGIPLTPIPIPATSRSRATGSWAPPLYLRTV